MPGDRVGCPMDSKRLEAPGYPPAQGAGVDKPQAPSADMLVMLAEKVEGVRQRRSAFIGGDTVSETGWEMLLALYRSHAAMHRMTVSNLCRASHAPHSTALRWLDRLEQLNLVYRLEHKFDRRVTFVELTPEARDAIHAYLSEIWVSLYGTP